MGHRPQRGERGIWKHKSNPNDPDLKVADFSYQNPALAQMIIDAWNDPNGLGGRLIDHAHPDNAKQELANRGIYLNHPVVLTEDEYNNGWQMEHDDEVAFVLPDASRKTAAPAGQTLLETAKLLMACVPNGI